MDGRDIRRSRDLIGIERGVAAGLFGVDSRTLESWEDGSVEPPRSIRLLVALQSNWAKYWQLLHAPDGLDAWHRCLKQAGRANEE